MGQQCCTMDYTENQKVNRIEVDDTTAENNTDAQNSTPNDLSPPDTPNQQLVDRIDHSQKQFRSDGATLIGELSFPVGKIIYSNGDVYTGEWRAGLAHGNGEIVRKDESTYRGQWVDDCIHGFGREIYPDGSWYEGGFQKGRKSGNGIVIWESRKARYVGQFHKDLFEGYGTYEWSDGRKYTGEWYKGRHHGYGRMEWGDGRIYEGQYANDRKFGIGIFVWADDRAHIGEWIDGRQHGAGVFATATNLCRKGIWSKGIRVEWESSPQSTNTIDTLLTANNLYLTPPKNFPTHEKIPMWALNPKDRERIGSSSGNNAAQVM